MDISYSAKGAGPEVLFIQGVGVHGDGWRPQVEELAARFTCVSFDNRGMGRSAPAGPDLTLEQMTADAQSVMDAVGWRSAHVVGHSLGGLVALYLALAARERVRSLSLLCTFSGGRYVAPLTARMMWWGMRSRVGTARMRRRGFLGLVMPPPAPRGEEADRIAARLAPLFGHDIGDQPAAVAYQLKAMRQADATARLAELAGLKTLVVSAEHDPIAPPSAGRILAAGIPGARYVEIAGASHGLPITHAARVNEMLSEQFRMG